MQTETLEWITVAKGEKIPETFQDCLDNFCKFWIFFQKFSAPLQVLHGKFSFLDERYSYIIEVLHGKLGIFFLKFDLQIDNS